MVAIGAAVAVMVAMFALGGVLWSREIRKIRSQAAASSASNLWLGNGDLIVSPDTIDWNGALGDSVISGSSDSSGSGGDGGSGGDSS